MEEKRRRQGAGERQGGRSPTRTDPPLPQTHTPFSKNPPPPVPFDRRNGSLPCPGPARPAAGGIIIDWQAMDPNSPAAELEVVGSLSPPFTPHPPAAASAHADSDDGGGEVEFANFTDQELGSKIRFWEGELQRGALRKTQDKGKKLRARVGRMKKELDRRIVHRQKQDDTVRRRAVQAKSTCGNGGNVYDFINKCTDGWPKSLSKLEKAKEHDMQIL
ncbi:hypothetical protein PVAP13_5NG488886 [Panicum virgatum]|uniref:Uncharacterized protein n=1 Tax=Panicum virgatum TaxID=38727 RepID=A0A8T0S3Z8_PANVG|nr:hypothetical protein PVAP13_5NG488886 [Panicum virgatum]